ncbi:MAG: DUF5723 family protein [Bacteroidota bacterium]
MNRTLILVLTLGIAGNAFGGDRSGVRGIGMARTVNAPVRGLAALGINPANLALGGEGMVSMSLMPFGFRVSSELISMESYRDYFTGVPGPGGQREPRYLSDADKVKIIDAFSDNTATSRFDLEIMSVGVAVFHPSFGGIGAAMTEHIGAKLVVPKDLMQVMLYGLDSAGSRHQMDGTDVSAWWWREFNLSYGTKIPVKLEKRGEVYAGIGLKYVAGFGILETTRYRMLIANERDSNNQYRTEFLADYLIRRSGSEMMDPGSGGGPFTLSPHPAGTGFGLDLGVAVLIDGVRIHWSVTDLGSVSWRRNLVETYGDYNVVLTDPFLGAIEDSIQNAIRGQNRSGTAFRTSLPATMRFGIAIGGDTTRVFDWLPRGLYVALDLTQGLNESMGNSQNVRASLGIEYTGVPWLPIRTGWSLGDDSKIRWAVGIALESRSFSWDIATENIGLLFSTRDFNMYSFATGFRLRF